MKALTIWQPWAWAIAARLKPVENRTWAPPSWMIGKYIAIHAGKKVERDRDAIDVWKLMLERTAPERKRGIPTKLVLGELPTSAIVAVARLVRVVEVSDDPWFVGPYGWWLEEVVQIEPIACSGAQGLWDVPIEVLRDVRAAYAAARRAA